MLINNKATGFRGSKESEMFKLLMSLLDCDKVGTEL
jgi:hypothetical protein